MQFSTRAEYGLKALANLAADYPNRKSVAVISRQEKISEKYLEQLFSDLRKKDIIQSFKGKFGGYVLSADPKKITVGKAVEALEGSLDPMGCSSKDCQEARCVSKKVWVKLEKKIRETLDGMTLGDLI